jgi:tubulin--tyrosine ligase-like protein 12
LREVPGLAERMAALMCVEDTEESEEAVDGVSHQNGAEPGVLETIESEISNAKEKGENGGVLWLELEELGIDDHMLLSLDLSSRFPV